MDYFDVLGDINYIGVALAVVSTFVVGMVWYAESVFGKAWMKLAGLTKKQVENKEKMMKAMMHSFVASIITAVVLAGLMYELGIDDLWDGAVFGAIIGFGLAAASMVTHDAFEQRKMALTRINGLHDVLSFAVMAAIIAAVGF